jgi:hypothetical protein
VLRIVHSLIQAQAGGFLLHSASAIRNGKAFLFSGISGADLLLRYKDEDFSAFCDIQLKDVNQVGRFGERPLHVACTRGILEEIAALIEGGAGLTRPASLIIRLCTKPCRNTSLTVARVGE